MLSRRDVLKAAAATATIVGASSPASSQMLKGTIRQDDLLRHRSRGQVTLLHVADLHAQLMPVYFREPSVNLGVGEARGLVPHITDRALLKHYGIDPGSYRAYALSSADFEILARAYGRLGGMDRLATLVKVIIAERRDDRVLLLDGGDALQGSYTALKSQGADMVGVLTRLGVAATTGHWEFTLGAERVKELFGGTDKGGSAKLPFLAGNVVDTDFEDPVFPAWRMYEKGGVPVAVIGQAFPYTPIANPRWMMPGWSFGIRESALRRHVQAARAAGAQLIVLLSHNGFDVDRKLAGRVAGIDVILTAHTHDALPEPVLVDQTLLIASGSHGKFLSRLDIEVANGRKVGWSYSLIPVLSDAITPDADMARYIAEVREPHGTMLATELARTDDLLYRRGNFGGSLDDLICDAMLAERDAEICLSPGFRWGASLLPGQSITWDDIYNATAITYPACYRTHMNGGELKAILEDVADNLFNPDPYYQQGGDMVRVGGMSFRISVESSVGSRISDMTLLRTGERIETGSAYAVAGWASVNAGTAGPPIWDVVAAHLRRHPVVRRPPAENVSVVNWRSGSPKF